MYSACKTDLFYCAILNFRLFSLLEGFCSPLLYVSILLLNIFDAEDRTPSGSFRAEEF